MIRLGPDKCRRLDEALAREWIVTNGLGGYASSTVPGTPIRRYHGLLVVARHRPVDRWVAVAQVDELVTYGGRPYQISTTEYQNDTLAPAGYIHLAEFRLERGLPITSYEIGDVTLEKRVWMAHGRDTTYVQYRWPTTAVEAAELVLRPLVSGRPFHELIAGDPHQSPRVETLADGLQIQPTTGAPVVQVRLPGGTVDARGTWHWRVQYRLERERGLDFLEDLYMPGTLAITLPPGGVATLIISTEAEPLRDSDVEVAWRREWQRRDELMGRGDGRLDDDFGRALTLAADAFIVAVPARPDADGSGRDANPATARAPAPRRAVIGGYHWFSQAGRDALIGLPGLLLATGRAADARAVLQGLLDDRRDGLLPVRYGETDGLPDYASVDTTLWLFVALRAYLDQTGDRAFLLAQWAALREIIAAHVSGTRYGIVVDSVDGLLWAGEAGYQLTWMDAKAGAWVVTPRQGKPVEINALWYNAVRQMAEWARHVAPAQVADYLRLAHQAEGSFTQKFWYFAGGYLYDAIETGNGNDTACRPNQVLAIGLPFPVLERSRWRPVFDEVKDHLLTPVGLRTLSPADPQYVGWYAGDAVHRDGAYHQGSVRTWLLGPFSDAGQRVYPGNRLLVDLFQGLQRHLEKAGLGTVSELFDGAPPHSAQGSIADAAGVGEVLRVWRRLSVPD